MKRYLLSSLITLLLFSFLIPLVAEGQIVKIENPFGPDSTLWTVLDKVINFIIILAIAVAPIMFIIAGFYFVTAAGDPAKITIAKHMVLYTLIGLLIVLCATGLVALFGKVFGVKTPYNP